MGKFHQDKMKRLFKATDASLDDRIEPEEFRATLNHPEVREWFAAQGLSHTDDADLLFRLLDKDKSGTISKMELLSGVSALEGNARSIDLKILLQEVQSLRASVSSDVAAMRCEIEKSGD